MAKVILGRSPQDHYPATVAVIRRGAHLDIRIHLVPIAFSAFEVLAFSQGHDAVLPLLSASVVAPQMILGLAHGLEGGCSSSQQPTSLLKSDHSTPLAAVLESFQPGNKQNVLTAATHVTSNSLLSVRDAAHLHHLNEPKASTIATPAGQSGIAAGVPIYSYSRAELGVHALALPVVVDENGKQQITSLTEVFLQNHPDFDLSAIAVVLGVSTVLQTPGLERKMERVLTATADTPLHELVRN